MISGQSKIPLVYFVDKDYIRYNPSLLLLL